MLVPEAVVAVAAGNYHTLALAESGNVWAWGGNDQGQLGIGPDEEKATEPRLVKALQGGWCATAWREQVCGPVLWEGYSAEQNEHCRAFWLRL